MAASLLAGCDERQHAGTSPEATDAFPYTVVRVEPDGTRRVVETGTYTRAQQLELLAARAAAREGKPLPKGVVAVTTGGADCGDLSTFLVTSAPNLTGSWFCTSYSAPSNTTGVLTPWPIISWDASWDWNARLCYDGPSDAGLHDCARGSVHHAASSCARSGRANFFGDVKPRLITMDSQICP